jgi:excisionase family DNA binding protein
VEVLAVRVNEAARIIGVSRSVLYPLLSSGTIPSFKVGAVRLVPVDALRRWVAAQAAGVSEGHDGAAG